MQRSYQRRAPPSTIWFRYRPRAQTTEGWCPHADVLASTIDNADGVTLAQLRQHAVTLFGVLADYAPQQITFRRDSDDPVKRFSLLRETSSRDPVVVETVGEPSAWRRAWRRLAACFCCGGGR